MPSIHSAIARNYSALPGVIVYAMDGAPKRGAVQRVLVCVAAGMDIPLHTHSVDAEMFIVAGSGVVLSVDENNGRAVCMGDVVLFERDAPHGFRAGSQGLTFVSSNGGIVDADDDWDISFN